MSNCDVGKDEEGAQEERSIQRFHTSNKNNILLCLNI